MGFSTGGGDIPKGTDLSTYVACIKELGQQDRDGRDASYLYHYGPFLGYECVLDAKFTVGEKQLFNGGLLNHKCVGANCEGRWVSTPTEWYLVYKTKRIIKAGEQLTISYNGSSERDPERQYLRKMSTLAHLPPGQVVACLCAHPKECPKKMGFDRMVIYGKVDGQCLKYT